MRGVSMANGGSIIRIVYGAGEDAPGDGTARLPHENTPTKRNDHKKKKSFKAEKNINNTK